MSVTPGFRELLLKGGEGAGEAAGSLGADIK